MVSITSLVLLAASSIASAASVPLEARAAAFDSKMVYAYGATPDAGIGGVRLTYGDGTAFVGNRPPSNVSVASNITFSWDSSSGPIGISPNSSNVTFGQSQYFYINPNGSAFDSVQISDSAPSDSYTDTGFVFYGNWLFWKSDAGKLESKFYATPSDENGVWTLKWNAGSSDDGTSVPISLRTIAPSENKRV
ncbi:cytochrome p450 protein [Diplodia corticola]|uniref:Cytochrome p450 protein n=1 Tax=Diplodia corticola TaxID=236234 RepID=A0A1J9REY6_9PEZI|nr:cytochrome p450 protein [Diplodia corticola]OJD38658.1 cytochrome p450 protein [Diplodia corticola]